MKSIALPITVASLLCLAAACFAADTSVEAPQTDPPLTERIRALIAMLVDPNPNLRRVAERQLIEIGEPVVPILTEIMSRSTDIGIQSRGKMVLNEIPNALTLKKLQSVEFKEINFKDAELAAVVDFLADETSRLAPHGRGINFVVKDGAHARKIQTLRLRAIPLYDALKIITGLADCEFHIENGIVVIQAKQTVKQ
jgi:hypothetical protein